MNKKKIFMIIVLITFIGIIVFLIINVNNKSMGKVNEMSNDLSEITNQENNINSFKSPSQKDVINIPNNENKNEITDSQIDDTKSISDNSQNSGNIRKSKMKPSIDMNNMVEITDNFFIEQTNDMYLNLEDYVGKTIKIAGLIYYYEDENKDICYTVIRNTPGCCGNDGIAGLDIRYDEDYPPENTWVEIVGVIATEKVYDSEIPVIHVATMTVKEKGVTFVTN